MTTTTKDSSSSSFVVGVVAVCCTILGGIGSYAYVQGRESEQLVIQVRRIDAVEREQKDSSRDRSKMLSEISVIRAQLDVVIRILEQQSGHPIAGDKKHDQ